MSDRVRVLITGATHPHRGETGKPAGIVSVDDGGPKMVKVDLDGPHLGVDSCFATAAELQRVPFAFQGASDAH